MVRCKGSRACTPSGARRIRSRSAAPDNPRATGTMAGRLRAGMEQLPHRAAALHRHHGHLDPVLARSQSQIPPLRPTRPITTHRRPAHRDRPRPHRHLLGLTPNLRDSPEPARGGAKSAVTPGPIQVDIARAILEVIDGVPNYISKSDGRWLVLNPRPDMQCGDRAALKDRGRRVGLRRRGAFHRS